MSLSIRGPPVTGGRPKLAGTNGTANRFLHRRLRWTRATFVRETLLSAVGKEVQHELFATIAPGCKGDHQRASES